MARRLTVRSSCLMAGSSRVRMYHATAAAKPVLMSHWYCSIVPTPLCVGVFGREKGGRCRPPSNRAHYPCVRCLRRMAHGVPQCRLCGTGASPGLWYTFPGGGFVRIVITLLPAILMVVSFSVPIHAINAFDAVQFVVQFVAQSALATDDWQTQYWIGYDEDNPRCFENGYCVWEVMSPADPEWWRHNVQ